MHEGKRWRMLVDEFAIARGATEQSRSNRPRKRSGNEVPGRDHRGPRSASPAAKPRAEGALKVSAFLDQYYTNYVEAEGLKSADTISGHIKALKASLGELPVTVLEKPAEIGRFKAEYRRGHEVATVNRALGVLRAAINWGRFQDPRCSQPRRSIVSASASKRRTKRSGIGASTATRSRRSWPRARR